DRRHRIVYDYRPQNAITIPELYRTPSIKQIMLDLPGHKHYASIDIDAAFHRLRVKKGDEWKVAISTASGTYVWNVMPFGVLGGPTYWQRFIDYVLQNEIGKFCYAYADDIVIWADTEEELNTRIETIVRKLHFEGIKISWKKCEWN